MFNKAEIRILKFMLSEMQNLNVREISAKTKLNYRQAHEAVSKLEKKRLIFAKKYGKAKVCSLSFENAGVLAYIEDLRADELLKKKPNIRLVKKELESLKTSYYSLILFGSYAKGDERSRSDIDILFIIPDCSDINGFQKEAESIIDRLKYDIHLNTIKESEFVNMLKKRGELNIANEVLKNRIILSGAEQYYKLVKKA